MNRLQTLLCHEIADLDAALSKAKAAGVTIVADPYAAGVRDAAIVQFPGGYVAEIHNGRVL
ncbi:hypothetical protein SAMN05518801_1358 [Novosphingobium sp. CF614]|uniref:VOC family protein n=1 Tax=Novosphingobium sp. CF614 TaxID=1884364 RepID=UPI0008EE90DA|nr:hypothetical protein [Novosphingobium sp. CF614]SFG49534.1 hypothetical protein SAMN05518801_1358 [Novosphingobium sp. CF614]